MNMVMIVQLYGRTMLALNFLLVGLILALTNCFSTKVIGAMVDDNRDISSYWFGAVDDDSLFWHGLGSDFIDRKEGF